MDEEQVRDTMLDDTELQEPPKKWQWLFQVFGFLGFVGVVAAAVTYLPIFKLGDIFIAGNTYISSEDICRIAGV